MCRALQKIGLSTTEGERVSEQSGQAAVHTRTRAHTHFRPEPTRDANDRQHIFFGITKKQKMIVHEII